MSTVIYPSPVFGPIHSRRLGVSLGINLLPGDGKVCTFDCLYCECGFNADFRAKSGFPTREQVREVLEAKLQSMQKEGVLPDVLTFAGNGEPTIHPDFAAIIDDTIALRDAYCPSAKVSVLSNATQAAKPQIKAALLRVDNNILKLDTVNADYIRFLDRPTGAYDVEKLIHALETYEGKLIIQTMFLSGESGGRNVDNTGEEYVQPWLDALKRIRPQQVMIYTIDRETPDKGLRKASADVLDHIAVQLRAEGFDTMVSY